jgi:hypothetical protein
LAVLISTGLFVASQVLPFLKVAMFGAAILCLARLYLARLYVALFDKPALVNWRHLLRCQVYSLPMPLNMLKNALVLF